MGLTVTIHQPHYLPYSGLFDKADRADLVIWLDNAAFSKGGWHNRNRIKTHTGEVLLTVPVARSRAATGEIRDLPLAEARNWQHVHEKTVRQAYAHAEHLPYCDPLLDVLYRRPWRTLGELADACCAETMRLLGIDTPTVKASDLGTTAATKSARLVELCRRVGADTYLAGDGSRCYLDEQVFADAGIEICWQDYQPPRYPQLHARHGFLPNLGTLDLLANTGPGAIEILRAARTAAPQGAAA
ncbi:WbqC family protein [Kitasatospora sp. NRRL B-11411]|uniref:WbqC family protein n=1 Tax=Kitasatospora sp. NRRL B-11411 TaxID=1463822 RepID=UPI0004C40C36|nr:WbqC family protein [Kitasatospora sp. NRRL B-11411]